MKNMRLKFTIRKEVRIVVAGIILVCLVAFGERQQKGVPIRDVVITIDNAHDNHYLNEQDVLDLVAFDKENLMGATIGSIDMKDMETMIEHDPYVNDAQLYVDLKGNLIINANLHRPVARMVRSDGSHRYIAEDGTIMPVSTEFSSRVLLVSGRMNAQFAQLENLNEHKAGKQVMALVDRIRRDEFWTAQIAQIDIDEQGRAGIYPQVGGQVIEFGPMEDLDTKFLKMTVFYKEILPRMGWNTYDRVNLEYKDQIVAE